MSDEAGSSLYSEHGGSFTDSLLLARAGANSQIGEVLERCRPYLLAIAEAELPTGIHGKLGASDVVQDTLTLGVQHFGEFRGTSEEELAGWLRRILLNRVANVRRLFATEQRDLQREQTADSGLANPEQLTPSGLLAQLEEAVRLERALLRLPAEYQTVIRMRHHEDRTFAEIGAALGKTENAASKLWVRAVQRLQQEFGCDPKNS